MKKSFWEKLHKPFFALAPMADVTDAAFRKIIAKYGKPDIFWTEFTSADGLCSPGRDRLLVNLKYSREEHPIVAQLFGANPEKMYEAAKLVKKLGFDGLDINLGCPDRSVVKQGAGGALIKTPKLAQEIIHAAQEGAGSAGWRMPVSVKTRLGFSKDILEEWLPVLLETNLAAVTIHARTVKELSLVKAQWERGRGAGASRNKLKSKTLIIGNGDVIDLADARQKAIETGADGIMLGRAIFDNPWLFSNSRELENSHEGEVIRRKLAVLIEHVKLFERYFGDDRTPAPEGGTSSRFAQKRKSLFGTRTRPGIGAGFNSRKPQKNMRARIKNFAVMKKHFKAYVGGFEGAKDLRARLMECNTTKEAVAILKTAVR